MYAATTGGFVRSTHAVILAFLLSICAGSFELASSQTSKNQRDFVVDAVKIPVNLELTGTLTDPRWSGAPTIQCPFEVDPGENIPAKRRTWVKILYSDQYLYFGFVCEDTEASAIRAHMTDRDNNFADDFVFVAIDPFRTNQRAYEFVSNPFGIQGDLLRTGNNEDASWDAVWEAKGAISDSGYTVEMAIPFKSLHFPSAEVQDWSLMVIRNIPRDSRYQVSWTPIDRNDPCSICIGGTMRGLRGLQSTTSLELLPYAMGYQAGEMNDKENPASGFTNGKVMGRMGGSVKYAPDPNVTVEAVANPDFSQVESDATQISVNTTFALFYPEKRPFFLDGTDLLNTQIQTFYTRLINNPIGAAKFIDKSGGWSVVYLGAEDRNSPFIVPGEEGSAFVESSLHSLTNAVRAKYEFGKQSYVGAIGTARNFSDAHNYVGGVDWSLFFNENYTFDGQVLYSQTKEVNDPALFDDSTGYGVSGHSKAFDGESFGGGGLFTEIRRDARNYSFQISYQDFSPTFQAQDGFVTANDLRTLMIYNEYDWYPLESFVDRGDVFFRGAFHFNANSVRKERWAVVGTNISMKSQTHLTLVYLLYNEELFHNVRFFGINRGEITVSTAPSSAFEASTDLQIGRFINRAEAPSAGYGHVLTTSFTLKPTAKLEIDLSYSRSRLTDIITHDLLFDGYIARCVGIYQFSPDLFVRLVNQYDGFQKVIEIDPLLSYKLNPFTIFYVGSTHSLTNFDDPFGVQQTARQYFIKLQYLWRT